MLKSILLLLFLKDNKKKIYNIFQIYDKYVFYFMVIDFNNFELSYCYIILY